MSCVVPYIEDAYRQSNPDIADKLTIKYQQIWDRLIDSDLFENDSEGRFAYPQQDKPKYEEQVHLIETINTDYGTNVVSNLNGYLNVNVLGLANVVKPGVQELFENEELANQVYEAAGIPKLRLYRVYNPSAKGVVIEGQEKYTGQWFTTDLDYALSYVEKNKKVIKGQNVTDNKYDYSDLKVDVVELNPSEAKKYLLSQETILKENLDVEPDNFIIPSTIKRSATINIGKEIGISNKIIKSFLPSEKDVFKKNIPLPTTSKFENLLQLEQQAQQLYSQYLEQNPNGSVEQFKNWVEEFNKSKRTPLTPTAEQLKHIKPLSQKLIEQVNNWVGKSNKEILNTLKLYAEVYSKDKDLERLIEVLIDNVDKIKFVKFKGIGKLDNNNNQAEYDGETGEIFVNNIMYQPNNRDVEDRLYRTIIHEYLHGYFLSVLNSPKTEQEKQLVEYINEAYDVLTFEYEGTEKWYGFHNVDEFVSELLSNKEFRESEQVKKTGIIQNILNFINQIFFKKYGKNSIEIKQNTFNKILESISILEPTLVRYASKKGSLSDFISQKSQENSSFQQFQQSLNKPNTNPVLQDNQQEQIKKFIELRERLNDKEFLEGAKNAFESSEELQNVYYEAAEFRSDRDTTVRNSIVQAYKNKTTISLKTSLLEDLLEFDRTKNEKFYTDKELTGVENIKKLKESIKKDGLKEPLELVINSQGAVVLAEGNHRFQALKELGYKEIPVIVKGRGSKDEYFTEVRQGKQVKLGLNLNKDFNAQITPQQKQEALNAYTDYIARVSLGIIKNPSSGEYNYTSQVKDIVYHGTNADLSKGFSKEFSGKGSGSPIMRGDIYTTLQPETTLQYIAGIGTIQPNKLWTEQHFELKRLIDIEKRNIPITENIINKTITTGKWRGKSIEKLKEEYNFTGNNIDFLKEVYGIIEGESFNEYKKRKQKEFKDIWKNKKYSKAPYSLIVNIQNPLTHKTQDTDYTDFIKQAERQGNDGLVMYDNNDAFKSDVVVAFEPEQIHILSSKADIQGFKDYMAFQNSEFAKYGTYEQFRQFITSKSSMEIENRLIETSKIDRVC